MAPPLTIGDICRRLGVSELQAHRLLGKTEAKTLRSFTADGRSRVVRYEVDLADLRAAANPPAEEPAHVVHDAVPRDVYVPEPPELGDTVLYMPSQDQRDVVPLLNKYGIDPAGVTELREFSDATCSALSMSGLLTKRVVEGAVKRVIFSSPVGVGLLRQDLFEVLCAAKGVRVTYLHAVSGQEQTRAQLQAMHDSILRSKYASCPRVLFRCTASGQKGRPKTPRREDIVSMPFDTTDDDINEMIGTALAKRQRTE